VERSWSWDLELWRAAQSFEKHQE